MTTYAERTARGQAWQGSHPTSASTPAKRDPLDIPEGALPPDETDKPRTGKDTLLLVAIVVLAPLWLPAWGVYLIWEWFDLRRRPGKTCLTYHPTLKDFPAQLAREREEESKKAQIPG